VYPPRNKKKNCCTDKVDNKNHKNVISEWDMQVLNESCNNTCEVLSPWWFCARRSRRAAHTAYPYTSTCSGIWEIILVSHSDALARAADVCPIYYKWRCLPPWEVVAIMPVFKVLDFWAFCLFLLKPKNCHVAKDISQRGMVLIITVHRSGGKRAVFF